eukprot:ANDGO_06375.mRNA.2 Leucine-rich repeat-containing protein 45 OS=Gallus gallus GN=LRRC45 PE=2 SV=1
MGLRSLDLRNNRISAEAAVHFLRFLKMNGHLQVLDLRWNSLGAPGGKALAELLESNTVLQDVQIAGNQIPYDITAHIERLLQRNRDQSSLRHERDQNMSIRALEETKNAEIDVLKTQLSMRADDGVHTLRMLEDQVVAEKSRRHRLDEELARADSEKARLQDRTMDLERALQLAHEENAALKVTNGRLRQDSENMKVRIEEASMESSSRSSAARDRMVANLETEVSELRRECGRLSEELRLRSTEKDYLESELSIKETRLRQIEESSRHLEARLRAADEEAKSIRTQMQRAVREAEDLLARAVDEKTDTERTLRSRVDEVEQARQALHREYSSLERESLIMKRDLEEELSVAHRNMELLDRDRKKSEKEIEDLRLGLRRTEFSLEASKRAEQETRASLEAQVVAAKERVDELLVAQSRLVSETEDKIRQRDSVISALQDEAAAMRREHQRITGDHDKILGNLETSLAGYFRTMFTEARRQSSSL